MESLARCAQVLGRPEKAGGWELWSAFPAAVLIPAGGAGMRGEIGGFLDAPLLEFGQGMHLAWPVPVPVLAERIYKGKERVGICHPGGPRREVAASANFPEISRRLGVLRTPLAMA